MPVTPPKYRGKRNKLNFERLKQFSYIHEGKQKLSIEEYCQLIAQWLLEHTESLTVLDYYSTKTNQPFEYRLEEVLEANSPAIYAVLSERILDRALRGGLNPTVSKILVGKKVNPDGTAFEIDNGEFSFKFG